jgi:predicted RNase H-like HicB family nuclease
MQQFYLAIIGKARHGYGVFFPDLPGCTSFGMTVLEAARNAGVAAQGHAAVTLEYGEELPKARSPEEIPYDPKIKEAARLLVPIEVGEEPVRVNISLPASALEALDRTARELSLTRSGAIAHLALARDTGAGRFVHREPRKARRMSRKGERRTKN